MAQRRMFSLQIVDTDAFMDMPLSSQALYFHLGMRADDDGFVSNARRIQKLVGASDDDLRILLMKRFVLAFPSGVIVIKHWKISNYIQKDRYRPTLYKDEKATLFLKPDGAYTDHPFEGAKPCIQAVNNSDTQGEEAAIPEPENGMDTTCIHRLGKDRLGEVRLGKDNNISGGDDARARAEAEQTVSDYLLAQGTDISQYFGASDEAKSTATLFAQVLFRRWTSRKPNEEDIAHVFLLTRMQLRDPETGEWTVTFPQGDRELLMYAFEAASNAGKPGDWNYITGVWRNLHMRNIRNLDEAAEYDVKRDEEMGKW